ncbi:TD and POZ domain-containing protein 4 [Trichonephila clavata]|uniref:TD and POZ domain-containing protein 4 n=1 Tax=Trichonephila clavata TaxID=2740835 RepID=A0A8X6FA82_TRICU|nr:TD and POZ domain-containing protein 4 [Trichonephila clavata]
MADNNDCNSIVPFTYIWAIENCPVLLSPFPILSPLFIIDNYRNSHWRLGIVESSNYIQCFFQRQEDNGPETVHLSSEISLLDTEGCPLITKTCECTFQKGGVYEYLTFALLKDVFVLRRNEFLSNETLTFRFRSFSVHGEIIRINMCCARTRLKIHRMSFLWTIRDFTSLRVGESVSRSLVITQNKCLFLTLQLTEEGTIKIRIASNGAVRFNLRISVLDITGKAHNAILCKIQMHDPIQFNLMAKAYLDANRESFLPVGILTLRCEFILGTGIAHQEIESYRFTP